MRMYMQMREMREGEEELCLNSVVSYDKNIMRFVSERDDQSMGAQSEKRKRNT